MTTNTSSRSISRFKLGLIALSTIAGIIVLMLVLGLREEPTDAYHAYFDESVHGLELGAAVKFRGLRIGSVTKIGVAPDRRRIDVSLAIDRNAARRIDLARTAPSLRARLVLQGITGLKLIDIETAGDHPLPQLPFEPAERYIPTRPSLVGVLTANAESISNDVQRIARRSAAALARLEQFADELSAEDIPAKLGATASSAQATLRELRRLANGLERARVPDRISRTLDGLDVAIAKATSTLDRLGGDDGLVASAQRAADLVGDVGRDTKVGTEELADALRDIGDAARSARRFFDALDREPDMLLKGRAKERR